MPFNIDFSKKKTILVVGEQFPSNIYSWQAVAQEWGANLAIVTAPEGHPNASITWTEKILNSINEDTAVVAMAQVHWADGTWFDLEAIGQKTHRFDAPLIIDGTQSVGALPFDLRDLPVDALICGGYKCLPII